MCQIPTHIGLRSTSRLTIFYLASPAIGGSVVLCNIIDNNLYSNHAPPCVCFNINIDHTILADSTPDSKPAWWMIKGMNYKHVLEDYL